MAIAKTLAIAITMDMNHLRLQCYRNVIVRCQPMTTVKENLDVFIIS